MPLYELGIIVDPEVPPEDETQALDRLEKIISDAEGAVVDKETWGRRQLAYPINKKNYGVYHFWKFNSPGTILTDLNFELRTNDSIMRSLILNLDRELRRKRKMDAKIAARNAKKAAKVQAAAVAAADSDES